MVSVGPVAGAIIVLGSVAGAIMAVRRLFGNMNVAAGRRRETILSRYRQLDGYQIGGLRMDLIDLEIHPRDTLRSKARWFILGEIADLDGYADVTARLTAPKTEDGLADHFLADRLDIFECLPVTNGSVEEMGDGSVRLEFRVLSADNEKISQTLRDVHDRALGRSFNDQTAGPSA
jgi:hypothetical protein